MELIHVITIAESYSLLLNENVFSAFKLALNAEDDDKKVEFEEKIYLLNNKIAHEKYFDKVDPESFWKIEDEEEKRMYFYNLKSQCLLDEFKNAVDEEIKRKNKLSTKILDVIEGFGLFIIVSFLVLFFGGFLLVGFCAPAWFAFKDGEYTYLLFYLVIIPLIVSMIRQYKREF